ncbi:hypothetical protein B0A89_03640 [Paracoccus contaminans]|uniref:LysM domain-containing protein n=2 Tax=Paracoccus contaminans TaxID=1945662 RepID=A0A1W6D0Q9_9RHOB|nr:hypothetical protein B0A89_03640 [Paracoccus contaminans]
MPVIQWPLGQAGTSGGGAASRTGAAAGAGAKPQVVDPFAGQGVAQPAIPKSGGTAKAAGSTAAPARAGSGPGAPARAPQDAPQAGAGRTHTVATGETAWSVARKYGVSIQDLARANNLPETMSIRVGQRLAIPAGGSADPVTRVTAPGAGSPTPQPPSASEPLPSETTRPATAPAPKSDVPNLGKTRTKASGNGRLAMPANGSIVRTYKKGTNEGIDISAPPGSAVSAAASGTVAAVTRDTDGVPIVVVRHDSGLMTVYAGVDKLTVSKGDSVKRGQSIGTARNNGLVHFEVRNGFDSVNPEDYL